MCYKKNRNTQSVTVSQSFPGPAVKSTDLRGGGGSSSMSSVDAQQVEVLIPGVVVLQHRDLHLPPPTTNKLLHNRKNLCNSALIPADAPNLCYVL